MRRVPLTIYLFCILLFATPLFCEDQTTEGNLGESGHSIPTLTFKHGEKLIYTYQTIQKTTQHINDDEIHIESKIAWQFALHCVEQNDDRAQLRLSILLIKAAVKAPKFEHSIDTSIDNKQSNVPVIGHLALLNGKTLDLSYDKKLQRIVKISGAENIHKAFRKKYPKDEFDDVEHPLYLQAQQQFSNQALLRVWREIIRPPQRGSEEIALEAPLQLKVTRTWQEPDSTGIASYSIQPYSAPAADGDEKNAAAAIMLPLTSGPNPVSARLRHLEASGKLLLRDGAVAEATGSTHAQMDFSALTTDLTQDLELSWQLLLTKRLQASQAFEE